MATARFYEQTDMLGFKWQYGLPATSYGSKFIVGSNPKYFDTDGTTAIPNTVLYNGSFQLDKLPNGDFVGVSGGVLTGYSFYAEDILRARVTGLNYDAQAALLYMRDGIKNAPALLELSQELYSGNDTITGSFFNDTLAGFDGDDMINGNRRHDQLQGNAGNDKLDGDGGNDTLIGGAGDDVLTGDIGRDAFHFDFISEGGDHITDFSKAEDSIEIVAANFGGGLTAGALSNAQFQDSNSNDAATAAVRFIFDTDDFKLYFDADGSGKKAAVLIASFQTNADMNADNIFII